MRTVADVIVATQRAGPRLAVPEYTPELAGDPIKVAFMVESMKHHMTDEGYQLALALQMGGFYIAGHGFDGSSHIGQFIAQHSLDVLVLQDKREWIGLTAGPGFDHREKFQGVCELKHRSDIFKLTVLKDAHSDHTLHQEAAVEAGIHGWIVYYHPAIVAAQAPFARQEHMVRTYHSLDPAVVPAFSAKRDNSAVLSGALSRAYPLRSRLWLEANRFKNIYRLPHPGYGRIKCHTPAYLQVLSKYKVAICTSSRFGYAVRKIIEATAAGCVVITDLPSDDVLPYIDGNLLRVDSDVNPAYISRLIDDLSFCWNAERQYRWSELAKQNYDYRILGVRLASDIETMRRSFNVR